MNGGTSGGSPGSEKSTSGASGRRVPWTACCSLAWRSTSRLRSGASPGGATLSTTGVSPAATPASSTRKVRLEVPPVSGDTPRTRAPGRQSVTRSPTRSRS